MGADFFILDALHFIPGEGIPSACCWLLTIFLYSLLIAEVSCFVLIDRQHDNHAAWLAFNKLFSLLIWEKNQQLNQHHQRF